jgi:hypothetical protein
LSAAAVIEKAVGLMRYGGVPEPRARAVVDAVEILLGDGADESSCMSGPFPSALLSPLFDER